MSDCGAFFPPVSSFSITETWKGALDLGIWAVLGGLFWVRLLGCVTCARRLPCLGLGYLVMSGCPLAESAREHGLHLQFSCQACLCAAARGKPFYPRLLRMGLKRLVGIDGQHSFFSMWSPGTRRFEGGTKQGGAFLA